MDENQEIFLHPAKQKAQAVIQELIQLSSWEARYKKIIDIGRWLPPMDKQYQTEDWLVKGCQAPVWLYSYQEAGGLRFQADSTALITKGLVALVVLHYSGWSPEDILKEGAPSFFTELDLKHHLTPTRVGGLLSIVRQIRYYAQGFLLLSRQS